MIQDSARQDHVGDNNRTTISSQIKQRGLLYYYDTFVASYSCQQNPVVCDIILQACFIPMIFKDTMPIANIAMLFSKTMATDINAT